MNNVVRTAIQALAGVLGGTQSLHTNSLDEAWALPTEFAATIALRTQQIIAHETGVTNTVDPLGGSYFVETLTNEVERGAWDYIRRIDAMGGMVAAIEKSYPQREIAEASYRYQMAVDKKEKIIVGVNDYVTAEKPLDTLQIDETVGPSPGRTPLASCAPSAPPPKSSAASPPCAKPPKAPKTSCPTSTTPSKPTPPSAKSAKPCAPSSAPTKKWPSPNPTFSQIP